MEALLITHISNQSLKSIDYRKGIGKAESNRVEYTGREIRNVEAQSSRNTEDIVKSPNKYRETEGMSGDALITTDNKVLLENTRDLPAIMCAQRKAEKKIITEELLVEANQNSFGDEIGTTTNHITAMYDLLPLFKKDSEEYKTLEYRIMCGQLYQQNRYGSRSQKCVRKEIY